MRRAWVLALLAACATERGEQRPAVHEAAAVAQATTADLEEEVRAFIAARRPNVEVSKVEFEPIPTAVAHHLVGEEDDRGSGWSGRFDRQRCEYLFVSLAVRGGVAEVVRLFRGTSSNLRLPSGERAVETRAWRGTMPRADFERLARKAALLATAKLPTPPEARWERYAGISVRVGAARTVDFDGDILKGEEGARAELLFALIFADAKRWAPEEVRDPDAIAPCLLDGVVEVPDSWLRSNRVLALGDLGCGSAIPALEAMVRGSKEKSYAPSDAIERIRILQECAGATRAPAALVRRAEEHDAWALALLVTRFPDDCHALLYRAYDSQDRFFRSRALRDLAAYDPADLTLARRALEDPDRDLRVIGAFLLGDAERLLAIVRDGALAPDTRCAAIEALTLPLCGEAPIGPCGWWHHWRNGATYRLGAWRDPPGDRGTTGAALVALLGDPHVGGAALAGLADLGYHEATPVLLAEMRTALDDRDHGRAVAFALTLGCLRAGEAIEPLSAAASERRSSFVSERMGRALALTGDPRARPCLERLIEASRGYPLCAVHQKNLAFLDAILNRDGQFLLDGEADSSPRYVADLLAEMLTADQLRQLARAQRTWTTELTVAEHALEIKEAREAAPGPPEIPSR